MRFEGEDGLVGHSDGDVVCHAVADALLGAAALGDLGQHFPDTAADTEGIEGRSLLRDVVAKVALAGYLPTSVDATVICDRPAIDPRRDEMRGELAALPALGRRARVGQGDAPRGARDSRATAWAVSRSP